MKYEIIVHACDYYLKQYIDCPSTDNFEAQFFFWKLIRNSLTNDNPYIIYSELLELITLEIRKIRC